MIKKLLSIAFVSSTIFLNAQSFTATYSFAAVTPSTGTTDPTPVPSATGITFGSFSAVGTPSMNANTSGRFSFIGWPMGSSTTVDTYSTMTGAINPNEYYQVTLTPLPNYTIALNTCAFTVQRSGTGIRSYVVRTSADSYVNNLPASVSNASLSVVGTNEFFWNYDASSSALSGSMINFLGATINSATSFRFYAWNSEASTGTFSIDDVIFTGSATLATGLGNITTDLNANFTIYPVPSNDGVVFIENKNASDVSKIEVLDVLGKVVSTIHSTTNKVMLDLSSIANGTYSVRITTNASTSIQKIIVNK